MYICYRQLKNLETTPFIAPYRFIQQLEVFLQTVLCAAAHDVSSSITRSVIVMHIFLVSSILIVLHCHCLFLSCYNNTSSFTATFWREVTRRCEIGLCYLQITRDVEHGHNPIPKLSSLRVNPSDS